MRTFQQIELLMRTFQQTELLMRTFHKTELLMRTSEKWWTDQFTPAGKTTRRFAEGIRAWWQSQKGIDLSISKRTKHKIIMANQAISAKRGGSLDNTDLEDRFWSDHLTKYSALYNL